ncbi:DUF4159 domain-containing protein [Vannielia litorea]|uniref:N-terminal double-transmembrane domain-containing protein n=1 Tax=Vannielia litorea TaxID=1217970 RepID=A0A1N6DXF5_9RHOB|nr:DUF4159 domain-containing protein [Vannielia litorea]SIN75431.1 N-terminal double-transmembrane domain-containing protein [Vannielia litorea]
MFAIGPIGFTAPLLLWALVVLPLLWLLLRAVPPAPIRRRFPGVALLLGLEDEDSQTDRTPWWLLLLRMLAIAAIVIGFAGPVLNPEQRRDGSGPLVIVLDGGWADARDWPGRMARIEGLLTDAAAADRPVAVVSLTALPAAGELPMLAAAAWGPRLAGLEPTAWPPVSGAAVDWVESLGNGFETYWLSDGLAHEGRDEILAAFEAKGPVTVFESPRRPLGLRPARFEDGQVRLTVLRPDETAAQTATVLAYGRDPSGTERVLARAEASFEPQATEAEVALILPAELRNRVTRFEIQAARGAGAVTLTDDGLRRREVALIAGREDREGLELLSPLHYLQRALEPTADLVEGTLPDILLANPDAIIFADVADLPVAEKDDLLAWVEEGGMLLRFAGPQLAASDVSRREEDPLMPVRLREGGRSVGGAMSWGEPKALRPFPESSPFYGLALPADVTVTAQVMAQPDPELAERVIAALADGTPLVTRKRVGQGSVVLFHVTANAEWSSLPLSGLFVQMLERLAISTRPATPEARELEGTVWTPERVLDGFGGVQDAGTLPGVEGADLGAALAGDIPIGPDMRPGLYAGEDRLIALNVLGPEAVLEPVAWPARIPVEGLAVSRETALKGFVLSAALIALALDILASLWLGGRLLAPRARRSSTVAVALIAACFAAAPDNAAAQSDEAAEIFALEATTDVVLAHVITGDTRLDDVAHAGLRGLSDTLFRRTSIEPAEPIAVNLETDELAFFPFLYWPVSPNQPLPSDEAYAKLNRYLRTGGMILFDTRDADIGGFGAATPEGRKLQELAAPLDIPPLEPIPMDHVLTRTFYLLQDFPGRWASRDVWVEAAPPDAEVVEGMPFRNLNDGVTPVVIGGNDWAAAWAVERNGAAMFPVGRGYAGEQQREIAYRFGVNLIMHVLTGNYKSDQVHVPALLDRLGQ